MTDINEIFKYGSVEDLKIEISKSEHFNYYSRTWTFYRGFRDACKYGNFNIAEYLMSMESDKDYLIEIYNSGLFNACLGGHINIVELLIKNGADNFNTGIQGCVNGKKNIQNRMQIIELMLFSGANPYALPNQYCKYKLTQLLKFTKLHESLVDFILSH